MADKNPQLLNIDIGAGIEAAVDWIEENLEWLLDGIAAVLEFFVDSFEGTLLWLDPYVVGILLVLLGFWRVSVGFGIFCAASVVLIWEMQLWPETMSTVALVLSASVVAILVGIPVGISMSRSDMVERLVRPVLDLMQTMPPFVYLIPAAIFFGLGKVPGAIATVVFAMPPVIRLTNLGIRQVSEEHVEAGLAFGCTPRQLLTKVQMPLAMPTIMQGVNQTIMLSLSMVVIASMIGAGGLGNTVLTGIQRLNVGLGFEGGLGVVLIAILLDRLTQSFGDPHKGGGDDDGFLGRLKNALTGKQPDQGAQDEKTDTDAAKA
ncbi:MAG: proline/glycine betaine ABC transporter permease [Halofilum sp. (in: g-proteobacteria)]|nr:proline/glycine betaine ABC transporter permease [Halofilum sp. (in: g-proteobacteria)]